MSSNDTLLPLVKSPMSAPRSSLKSSAFWFLRKNLFTDCEFIDDFLEYVVKLEALELFTEVNGVLFWLPGNGVIMS